MRPTSAIAHGRTAVLCALVHHEATADFPPSISDLATATGLSRTRVHDHLKRLRKMGLLTWDDGQVKTLRSTVAIVKVAVMIPPRTPARDGADPGGHGAPGAVGMAAESACSAANLVGEVAATRGHGAAASPSIEVIHGAAAPRVPTLAASVASPSPAAFIPSAAVDAGAGPPATSPAPAPQVDRRWCHDRACNKVRQHDSGGCAMRSYHAGVEW